MSRCLVFLSFSRFSSELCVFSSCWESFLSSKNPRKSSKSPKHPLGKFQPDPSLESGPFPFHLPPSLCGPSMQRPISVVSLPASPSLLGSPWPSTLPPRLLWPVPASSASIPEPLLIRHRRHHRRLTSPRDVVTKLCCVIAI